jgi:mono/diheme cytochrome c family protein
MTTFARLSLGVFFFFTLGLSKDASAQPHAKADRGASDSSAVERGRYIVEDVVMCARCHTPGNLNGEGERTNWLKGGPLQIKPTYPVPNWAVITPRLAGGPPNTDAEFIRLITTGIARTGAPPRAPMPTFHMTRADAEAVLAYLKSLKY